MKPFTTFGAIVFAVVALAHLARLIWHAEVIVAGCVVPQWLSVAGLIVAGGLAAMLWREARR